MANTLAGLVLGINCRQRDTETSNGDVIVYYIYGAVVFISKSISIKYTNLIVSARIDFMVSMEFAFVCVIGWLHRQANQPEVFQNLLV